MQTSIIAASQRRYARWAGLGYLIIIVCGLFAEFAVRSGLIVAGNAAATAANILGAETLYRIGIAAEFFMLLADIFVAVALYAVFREVDRNLALLASFLRLAHACMVGINLLNSYIPLMLLGDAPYLSAFDSSQLQALVLLFLDAHSYGYVIGLVFFGFHCLVLGSLVLQSGYVPKVLGILLVLAALGYWIDGFGRTLLADYSDHEATFGMIVLAPAFVAEVSFCLWLLIRGVRVGGGPRDVSA